jgi:nucleoside-diphosphate kinase
MNRESSEASLVIIKPDAIQRGLTGPVYRRLEESGLQLIGIKVARVTRAIAVEHYNALQHKAFFEDLIKHICGELHGVDFVLVMVYWGPGAIGKIRQLAGATNPEKAEPRSLRGAFGRNTASGIMENVIHASSDPAESEREIKLWFKPDELLQAPYKTKMQILLNHQTMVWANQ